ncbi:MAG: AraC family transcriptional regulator, partial [Cyanobacteria bacterium P01_C01_bin.72]
MVMRLVLEDFSDCFEQGSTNDSRLLHSDKSDRIQVCQPNLGQGYIQEIILGDDISLVINNYRLDRDLIIDKPKHDSSVQFSFPLTDSDARYSTFDVCFGLRVIDIMRSRQAIFKVEVVFTQSTLLTYVQEFMARML